MNTFHVHVVSAEEHIFSGEAIFMLVPGVEGEMGITPNHVQLLSLLKPGELMIRHSDLKEDYIYVQGGILEVQPNVVTVLSDTAMRAKDIDETRALEAKERAERMLKDRESQVEYALVLEELARAVAQLRILEKIKKR
jgi:F-type H+-transporting ATPase subunit epsilon